MSRSNILFFSLAFLAFLCSQSVALPQFGGALRNTIMNAHATSSGIIDLNTDAYGQFYVEADLSYYWGAKNSSKTSNSTNSTNNTRSSSDTGRMMISIVNTDTMVSTSCLNFYYYDCSSYSTCSKLSYTKSIDYPTFTANVQYAQAQMYLDYNYWSISSSNYLYIAYSCSGSSSSSTGSGTYGILGLGTGNGGSSNFGYSPIFSIYINSAKTGGKLLFKSDTSTYAQSSNYVQSFYATNTWQISPSSMYIQVGGNTVWVGGGVIFDINSNAIGLPQTYYNSFVKYFGSQTNVYCYSSNSRPYCYFIGNLKDLPDITLTISGSVVKIPSAIYASAAETSGSLSYFYLNFKATSPSLTGVNYVSSTFQNSMILDANFMSYYYTVFDATNGYNYIYLYPSINGATNTPVKWAVSGAVVAILLISICCCCAKKKRGVVTSVTTAPLNNNTTTFNNTTQVVYNQPATVVTTTPTYSYDVNQYNYPAYNAQPQGGVYQNYQQPQGGVYQPYNGGQGYVPPAPVANFQESAK